LPLAAIAIRRDLQAACAAELDSALRHSVDYAFAHPDASREYVTAHAQEMEPSVVARHIQLYVNDYTRELDERAVHALLDWQKQQGFSAAAVPREGIFI
jgi:1,4-dihydroxy-6-naphthoate synthase